MKKLRGGGCRKVCERIDYLLGVFVVVVAVEVVRD